MPLLDEPMRVPTTQPSSFLPVAPSVHLPHQVHRPRLFARRQAQVDTQVLQQGASQAQEVLYEARTVFPFTLFPDSFAIDRVKVTITERLFFGHTQVQSVQIEDVLNVSASCGPLFGQVSIWTRFFNDRPLLTLKYLWRNDALAIERIMQGYSIARHQRVPTANIPKDQLVPLLLQLGEGSS